MRQLVFFLEEPSAEEMLRGILPKIIPAELVPRFIVFEGKQDLERQLVKRLRGYRHPNALFVVMRDQDAQPNCKKTKGKLLRQCNQAGRQGVLVRIACRELESFYLADLKAVERGLGLSRLASQQQTRKFRDPDHLQSPKEELKKLTKYEYQQVSGSRAIGPYLDLENTSPSYAVARENAMIWAGP
ncbi:MAG: DUF4276 family protein [Thermoguttaceae bacterium]|jgi:hypothetical protein